MGLAIRYFKEVTFIDQDHTKVSDKDVWLYNDSTFSANGAGLLPEGVEPIRRLENIHYGRFRVQHGAGFSVGPYNHYWTWRQWLWKLIHDLSNINAVWQAPGSYEHLAFFNLIHFSDCEGVIGPIVSARLAREFSMHQPKIDALQDQHFQFVLLYRAFHEAFESAAGKGAVVFV